MTEVIKWYEIPAKFTPNCSTVVATLGSGREIGLKFINEEPTAERVEERVADILEREKDNE